MSGLWSNVCSGGGFTPEAARFACKDLGFDGSAPLLFRVPYGCGSAQVPSCCLFLSHCS